MTDNGHLSRPLGPGNRELTCEGCGRVFYAKRSDAKTCGAVCRQLKYRRDHDPVSTPTPTSTMKDGSWKRTAREKLDRTFKRHVPEGDVLAEILRLVDVRAAVAAPDAPLEDWDARLTKSIRLLSKVRQAVRAEQASRRRT